MITEFDKKILNYIQTNLPISSKPFADMAKELGSTEEIVLNRVKELKNAGYIRKIGAFFNSEKLGYVSALVAVKLDSEYIEQIAKKISSYSGVTHNYQREGEFALWFTLSTLTEKEQEEILDEIRSQKGVESVWKLPAIDKYRVNVQFELV